MSFIIKQNSLGIEEKLEITPTKKSFLFQIFTKYGDPFEDDYAEIWLSREELIKLRDYLNETISSQS